MAEKTRRMGTAGAAADATTADPNESKVGANPKPNEEGFVRDQDLKDGPVATASRHEERGYSEFDEAAAAKANA